MMNPSNLFKSRLVVAFFTICKVLSDQVISVRYRVSQKIALTLQCHIFKNIEFDVFKFSTVI